MNYKNGISLFTALLIYTSLQAQVEVRDEPKHRPVLENEVARILDVWVKAGDSTKFHVHRTPSLFIYLSKTRIRTQEPGGMVVDQMVEPGQTWYNAFTKPFTHKAWVADAASLHAIDIELLGTEPKSVSPVLEAAGLTLLQDSTRHRTYRVALPSGTRMRVQLHGNPVIAIGYMGDGSLKVGDQDGDLYQGQYRYIEKDKWMEWNNSGEGRLEGYLYEIKQ
jgi:hypothetical protein